MGTRELFTSVWPLFHYFGDNFISNKTVFALLFLDDNNTVTNAIHTSTINMPQHLSQERKQAIQDLLLECKTFYMRSNLSDRCKLKIPLPSTSKKVRS